ncbi:MAG TPA: SET domain-containing protein [Patescibacteria group bacterium]|nr:SET domain-containing protein [Patescibacteria group bacterium]
MIHVKYKLDKSPLHGIGLFADQSIEKGQVVYTASPLLDLNISQKQFDSLLNEERQEIRWWGFFDKPSQLWHVDFDVSKFINHEENATLTQVLTHTEAYLVATRDIQSGEELTQNYLEFESEVDLKNRGIV